MNNIKKLRKEYLKLSQTEFGEKLGVSRSVINNLERELVELKEHMIKLICQTFNVNEDWLRNGNEPIFNDNKDELEVIFEKYELSTLSANIIRRYLNLSKEKQAVFEEFVESIFEDMKKDDFIHITTFDELLKDDDDFSSNKKEAL